MAYGLRCWDASGNIILDVTDRLSKRLGIAVINVNIPVRANLNTTIKTSVPLPQASISSGLSYWVHPTQRMQYNWFGNIVTACDVSAAVVGNNLEISLVLRGGSYAYSAITTSIEVEYGAY